MTGRCPFVIRSLLVVVIALVSEVGRTQEPTASLFPPTVTGDVVVPYPVAGDGDATVVLLLVVADDGHVQSVEVAQGDEPFASAARSAAALWRFVPATRDGKAVTAKVRYVVDFVAPPVPPEQSMPAKEEMVRDDDVIDVVVEGYKEPPSVSSLRRAEVRALPGAFGDPFRAVEVLPGVTPIISGLPFFYLRGSPPGNIGYFLDGVRVPYLFHVAAGPSVVHPAIVDRVDLYSGGYPAQFGRYAGGIVAAETTPPNPDWHGEGSIRIVDAGALVEGGFDEGKGTVLLGGRYSYTAALFSLISPDVTLDYRDFQARVSYDITPRDRISIFSFGSFDFLSNTEMAELSPGVEEEVETVVFASEFYRVDARYDALLDRGGKLRAAVTWGFDQTRLIDTRNSQNLLGGARLNYVQPLSADVTLRAGVNMQVDNYTASEDPFVDPDNPIVVEFNDLFPPRVDASASAWVDMTWKPTKQFEVTPGVRVDSYVSDGANAVTADPRLAVVVRASDRIRLLHAVGVANQPPAFVVPVPGLAVASLRGGLQRSIQASSGVEVDLPLSITATVTGYTGVYLNMTDAVAVGTATDDRQTERSLGSSKGLEIYVRRSLTKRLGGFVSYTFSRTTRAIREQRFVASFDRPHVLNAAVGYNLGRGWQAGTRFSVYSGILTERAVAGTASDPRRDSPFYRLDFRVEKKWRFLETGWTSFVVEMVNATLNKEVLGELSFGPVFIPSIGVEGGF